tara:strand:- start:222 stop:962 length:741 start_codon:yes stop_codon:yes gene_type:complete
MSGKSDTVKTLLVELDCLLDTRLGTLERLSPAAANTTFNGKAYFDRDYDDWERFTDGLVSRDAFMKAYTERDIETLALSRPTRFLRSLKDITGGLESQKIDLPDVEHVRVAVNVHPYQLSDKEKETLTTLVYGYCDVGTEVVVKDIPIQKLTPSAIGDYWDGVVLYDFDQWFKLHVDALNRTLIPRNSMLTAALYVKHPDQLKEEIPEGMEGVSAFALTELSLVERLGLEMLKAREFSIWLPDQRA